MAPVTPRPSRAQITARRPAAPGAAARRVPRSARRAGGRVAATPASKGVDQRRASAGASDRPERHPACRATERVASRLRQLDRRRGVRVARVMPPRSLLLGYTWGRHTADRAVVGGLSRWSARRPGHRRDDVRTTFAGHLVLAGLAVALVVGAPAVGRAQDAKAQKGQQVYDAQKCSMCHSVAGKGSKANPLDGVGGKLSSRRDPRSGGRSGSRSPTTSTSTKKPPMPKKSRTCSAGHSTRSSPTCRVSSSASLPAGCPRQTPGVIADGRADRGPRGRLRRAGARRRGRLLVTAAGNPLSPGHRRRVTPRPCASLPSAALIVAPTSFDVCANNGTTLGTPTVEGSSRARASP